LPLLRKNITASLPSYRFCIGVSATQNAFNCILIIDGLWTHILSGEFFLVIGPIKYAPEWIMDILVPMAVAMVFSL
ncbi:hypothetical protein PMAYCL1PPCAC_19219, partial [Pristionchus mayeri]